MNDALRTLALTQPALAEPLARGWDQPLRDWSAELWRPIADPGFEPAFRRALLAELGQRTPHADVVIAGVERSGAVLTPHHVCPTNGPTFGAIDWMACASAPGPVLVLAWSGVPMSNSAASGALCFSRADYAELLGPGPELQKQRQAAKDRERDGVSERRIVLVPPELRDALVYGCPMPARVADVVGAASERLRPLLPVPDPAQTYASWCTEACERVQRAVVGRGDLWYLDLNAVAARYLADVIRDEDHPVTRLLRRQDAEVGDLSWFYARRPGKRESVETFGRAPERWAERIAGGELCPGLVPVFGALRLLSRVTLLGGFRQVQYLEEIAQAWLRASVVDEDRGVPGRLVTGRLRVDGRDVHPLDVALGKLDRAALPGPDAPMSALWEPILARLIG